jgi:hypothetical protein
MSDFNPEHIYESIRLAGDDWADKKSAYDALDDNTKSVLAEITTGYMDTCKSKTEAEMRALASAEYKNHLRTTQDARRAFLKAQVKYDTLKTLAELRRSQESTRRAEMKL